jgi:hypothetical protein
MKEVWNVTSSVSLSNDRRLVSVVIHTLWYEIHISQAVVLHYLHCRGVCMHTKQLFSLIFSLCYGMIFKQGYTTQL